MCGIAGAFCRQDAAGKVRRAMHALQHRGPEQEASYQDPGLPLVLGHRRLCIIDRSQAAAQPMRYADRYQIVHNGELYNYRELQQQLKAKGHHFQSSSDTEVIVAAFAEWGSNCLQRFDGAFAFAIWDEESKTVFAARDRMGEKPFFFTTGNNEFLFASEMKALWQMGTPKAVNRSMLYNFLTLGYTTNPFEPQANFYENIHKLPPAHFLQFDAATGTVALTRYWQVSISEEPVVETIAVERFRQLLDTSVALRLRSDVPVGTSLSGGLDSSTIVALCAAQKSSSYAHAAFTASFAGFDRDETQQAAAVSKQFGLRHHIVAVTVDDLLRNMEQLATHQEEPVASASVLAQYEVYKAAKAAGITVLLDGQGADELLAGYHKYYQWYWRELYAQQQLSASGELESARALGISAPFGWRQKTAARFPHFAAAIWQQQRARAAATQRGLHPDFVQANKSAFAFAQPAQLTLNGVLHYNSFTNGLEELLRYADRNSMAHAVEVRLPFLQHELVEWLFTLPANMKIRGGWTKWLLRKSMQHLLPAEVVWRKDKVGFEPPQQQWMQDSRVQEKISQAKAELVAQGVLHQSVLQQPVRAAAAHAGDNADWRYWSAAYLFR